MSQEEVFETRVFIPHSLNQKIHIYKIENNLKNKEVAILKILEEKFEVKDGL